MQPENPSINSVPQMQTAQQILTPIPPTPVAKPKTNFLAKFKDLGTPVKIGLGVAGAVLTLCALLFLFTITDVDLLVFKAGLSGVIVSETNEGIGGATIKLTGNGLPSELEVPTSSDGYYEFNNLELGKYSMTISAAGFEPRTEEVVVTRSFLNYSNTYNWRLVRSGFGSINGKFITNVEGYSFVNDSLFLDDQKVDLAADGTFSLNNVPTGLRSLRIESRNFKDEVKQFQLAAGANPPLQDIVLTPAGDLTGSVVSHVRKDVVKDINFQVEGISNSQMQITAEGELFVKDLEVGKAYAVRISKDGYLTKDYTVTVVQGLNQIPGFKVVESGIIPFLSKVDDENQLFFANFDNSNRTQLTSEEDMNPFGEHIDGNIIYFLSDRDGVDNILSNATALLAYAVSTQGGNAQRLTTNVSNLGQVFPNFNAKKLVNITRVTDDDEDLRRKLEVMGLTGENRVEIELIPKGVFNDVILADSGAYIFYYMQNVAGDINGLYRANAVTGEGNKLFNKPNMLLFDVSHDGDRIIYSAPNTTTEANELYIYTVSTGQDRRLFPAVGARTQFQFIGTSRDRIIYQSLQDGANNVYELNPETNKETRLTNFRGTEGVEAVFQQSNYIVYHTNRGLYVMDPTKPVSGVMVTSEVSRFTGNDF